MGIPKFYRWLSERYPLISQVVTSSRVPDFDHFYLDMNGIIHKCSHPDNDKLSHLSEEEIFTSIFEYLDHLFLLVKPKRLFYLAIDGVAPRAKMNQQRSRRFRTAQETALRIQEARRKGDPAVAASGPSDAFDSNCITPGTLFMQRLSTQLAYFLHAKLSEDAVWMAAALGGCQIVLSGPDVPGEGEHKIMDFIRAYQSQGILLAPGEHVIAGGSAPPDAAYLPNTRHCIYGLDADLIMLGLLTHEPHTALLREQLAPTMGRKPRPGLGTGRPAAPLRRPAAPSANSATAQKFDLLHLSLLREYLDLEFQLLFDQTKLRSPAPGQQGSSPLAYSLERIIDDFIFLAIFIGNDFVPQLPSLHIHSHAFMILFEMYKSAWLKGGLDDYLNQDGKIYWKGLLVFLKELAKWELDMFLAEHEMLHDDDRLRSTKSPEKQIHGQSAEPRQPSRPPSLPLVLSRALSPSDERLKGYRLLDCPSRDDLMNRLLDGRGHVLGCFPGFIVSPLVRQVHQMVKQSFLPNATARAREFHITNIPFTAVDCLFIEWLAEQEGCSVQFHAEQSDDMLFTKHFGGESAQTASDENTAASSDTTSESSDDEAIALALKMYEQGNAASLTAHLNGIALDSTADSSPERAEAVLSQFSDHKRDYYVQKLAFDPVASPDKLNAMVHNYLNTLSWILGYYYHGVPSWSHFYHYHYSPKINDLVPVLEALLAAPSGGLAALDSFSVDAPLRPFEQLLAVLPPACVYLVPPVYQGLMKSANSNIVHYYPETFKIDLNGKKNDWEAIVMIPFIQTEALLAAMKRAREQWAENKGTPPLGADDERRNRLAQFPTRFTCRLDVDRGLYPCPMKIGSGYKDILHDHCEEQEYRLAFLDTTKAATMRPQPKTRLDMAPGFPTLYALPFHYTLERGAVKVFSFGAASLNESILLRILPPSSAGGAALSEPEMKALIGKTVWVEYPYRRESVITRASTATHQYEPSKDHQGRVMVRAMPLGREDFDRRQRMVEAAESHCAIKYGVQIGPIEVLVHARAVESVSVEGRKVYSNLDCAVPYQLVSLRGPEALAHSVPLHPPLKTPVVAQPRESLTTSHVPPVLVDHSSLVGQKAIWKCSPLTPALGPSRLVRIVGCSPATSKTSAASSASSYYVDIEPIQDIQLGMHHMDDLKSKWSQESAAGELSEEAVKTLIQLLESAALEPKRPPTWNRLKVRLEDVILSSHSAKAAAPLVCRVWDRVIIQGHDIGAAHGGESFGSLATVVGVRSAPTVSILTDVTKERLAVASEVLFKLEGEQQPDVSTRPSAWSRTANPTRPVHPKQATVQHQTAASLHANTILSKLALAKGKLSVQTEPSPVSKSASAATSETAAAAARPVKTGPFLADVSREPREAALVSSTPSAPPLTEAVLMTTSLMSKLELSPASDTNAKQCQTPLPVKPAAPKAIHATLLASAGSAPNSDSLSQPALKKAHFVPAANYFVPRQARASLKTPPSKP